LMCAIVVTSRRWNINPDNISTPLAASLGDLTTLTILAGLASGMRENITSTGIYVLILLIPLCTVPWWVSKVRSNQHVSHVLSQGWVALFVSMGISNISGLVLERYIDSYKPLALLCPILNGLVGNFGAIYTSRIATTLHSHSFRVGEEAHSELQPMLDPEDDSRTWFTLVSIFVPFQITVLAGVTYFGLGHLSLTPLFVILYMIISLIVVTVYLYKYTN
jgi:solute carrier family 41